jgi:hypothetical protein
MSKINRGMAIPDLNHVMRHIHWNKLQKDENNNVLGILPQALALRACDEGALSVNWVEYYDGTYDEKINKTVQDIRKAVKVGPKSAFGVSTVHAIKEACKNTSRLIKIVYWPNLNNHSHGLIQHLPNDDMALLDALSKEAFSVLIHNSAIP